MLSAASGGMVDRRVHGGVLECAAEVEQAGFGDGADQREGDQPGGVPRQPRAHIIAAAQHLAGDYAVETGERQRRRRAERRAIEQVERVELARAA